MSAKYIRNQHRFMIFSDQCVHREMAVKALPGKLIHGAGFLKMYVKKGELQVDCYGESESLRVKVRRDDHTAILDSIGLIRDGQETISAKYVIWRGKVVVFWHELEHEDVSAAAFFGSLDCESAGFVTLQPFHDGRVKIDCFGGDEAIMAKAKEGDNKRIGELFGLSLDAIV